MPRIILVFPLMVLLIMPLAADFSVEKLLLYVVDQDHSPASRRLVQKALASRYFLSAGFSGDYREALRAVEEGQADLILQIPRGFERDLFTGGPARVLIAADTVNGTKGGLGSSYLSRVVASLAEEVRRERIPSKAGEQNQGVGLIPRYLYNPLLEYPVFMVPALMVMLMAMLCGFLPALNIVGEKEKGTLEQLNVTPVKRRTLILSKLIPYWIIGFIVLTIAFGVARLVYRLSPQGSLLVIYLFASIFTLTMSGFGLMISNYAKTVQQAMFMMFFFVITFIFMSGLYTPVESMPLWARTVSAVSPLKYFMRVTRQVYLKGSGLGDLLPELVSLGTLAVFFNVWAVLSYRKKS